MQRKITHRPYLMKKISHGEIKHYKKNELKAETERKLEILKSKILLDTVVQIGRAHV